MIEPYGPDDLRLLREDAFQSAAPPPWINTQQVDSAAFGDDSVHEALTDYWMEYLHLAKRHGTPVNAHQVVKDFIELVRTHPRTYALHLMPGYIGAAIRDSADKATLLAMLEHEKASASGEMAQAWQHFMLDCREDAAA